MNEDEYMNHYSIDHSFAMYMLIYQHRFDHCMLRDDKQEENDYREDWISQKTGKYHHWRMVDVADKNQHLNMKNFIVLFLMFKNIWDYEGRILTHGM
jgi:hypothetical protein